MAKADGTIEVTGKITATSGATGGINVSSTVGLYTGTKTSATSTETGFLISKDGAIYLGAYSSTTGSCPFQVTSAGAMTATSGSIAGWSFDSTKFTGNKTGMAKTSADTDIAFWAGNATASSANFYVRQDGYVVAKNIDASGGKIGAWTIGTKLLSASSGSSYVALDGSTDLYPLSGLSSPSDHMYAIWAGGTSPNSAPFSVTKDGIVTITKLRIKKADNTYAEVSLNDFTYTSANTDSYDWDKLFAKLRFQTVRSVSQNSSTGQVTIRVSNNSGGTSSWTFNTATSVRLGDGTWSGASSSGAATYTARCFYSYGGNEVNVEEKATATVSSSWTNVGSTTGTSNSVYIYGNYTSVPLQNLVQLFGYSFSISNAAFGSDWKSKVTVTASHTSYESINYDVLHLNVDATAVWDMAAALTVAPTGSQSPGETFEFKAPLRSNPNPGVYNRGQHTFSFKLTKTQTPGTTGVVNVIMGESNKVASTSIGNWYTAGTRNVDLTTGWSHTLPYTGNSGNKLTVETTGRLKDDGTADTQKSREWTFYASKGDWPSTITRYSTCPIYVRISNATSGSIVAQSTVSASDVWVAAQAKFSEKSYNVVRFKRHTSSDTPSGTWYEIVSSGGDVSYTTLSTTGTYYTKST